MIPFYDNPKETSNEIVNEVEFSITHADEYFGDKFIEQVKKHIGNFDTNPNLTFSTITGDKNGRIFAIVARHFPRHHSETNKSNIFFYVEALTMTTDNKLRLLGSLTGFAPDFRDDNGKTYLPPVPLKDPSKEPSSLSSVLVSSMNYQNYGIGREMIVFWKSLIANHSSTDSMDLVAVNGQKNIPYYRRFNFSPLYYTYENGDEAPNKSNPMEGATGAGMVDNHLCAYFTSQAFLQTNRLHNSFSNATKEYLEKANKEVNDYLQTLRSEYNKNLENLYGLKKSDTTTNDTKPPKPPKP